MLLPSLKSTVSVLSLLSCLGLALVIATPSSKGAQERVTPPSQTQDTRRAVSPSNESSEILRRTRTSSASKTSSGPAILNHPIIAPDKAQEVNAVSSVETKTTREMKSQKRTPSGKTTARADGEKIERRRNARRTSTSKATKRTQVKSQRRKSRVARRAPKAKRLYIERRSKRLTQKPKQLKPKFAQRIKTKKLKTIKPSPKDNCKSVDEIKRNVSCIVERLQTKYRSIKSMTATFTQTYTYAVYQRTQTSTGKVFLKSPGRMRWDYKTPSSKVFVADGKNLWVYEPEKNQAYQRSLKDSEIPIAIRFLMGEGNLLKEFEPTFKSATPTTVTVELTPKVPTTKYKRLTMVISRADHMVQETTIIDPVNNTNRVQFKRIKLNGNLPDAGFKFEPPKGVNVVR